MPSAVAHDALLARVRAVPRRARRAVAHALACALACAAAGKAPAAAAAGKAPPAPALPAPQVTLDVEPSGSAADPVWTLRVKNAGATPLRLVTDPRLLRLELPPTASAAPATARGKAAKPRVVVCALPADGRPSGDGDALVLAPGKTYAQRFDVRTLCFGDEAERALAASVTFSATYGFPDRGLAPPFVVGPLDTGAPPTQASAKVISMASRSLKQAAPPTAPTAPTAPTTSTASTAAALAPRLTATQTRWLDARSADAATITVTIKNESSRTVALAFRPSSIALFVTTPSGATARCGPAGATGLARELVTFLRPGRSASQSVVLGRVCPWDAFDERGVYEIRASVDNRGTTVAGDLDTFAGIVDSPSPTQLRQRAGSPPPTPTLRPVLE
jgi:hypothetical protein